VLDLGTNTASVDYPTSAGHGRGDRRQAARGVLVCGTGIGISIAANATQVRAGARQT
jgi:ribose 5-phosphate isomerase B